jgi:hypothetical protein
VWAGGCEDPPQEAAEVVPAAAGPAEDPVVPGQRGGHDVPLRLLTYVALPVVDHPETTGKQEGQKIDERT